MISKKLEYDRQGLAVRLQEAMDDRGMSRDDLSIRSGYAISCFAAGPSAWICW